MGDVKKSRADCGLEITVVNSLSWYTQETSSVLLAIEAVATEQDLSVFSSSCVWSGCFSSQDARNWSSCTTKQFDVLHCLVFVHSTCVKVDYSKLKKTNQQQKQTNKTPKNPKPKLDIPDKKPLLIQVGLSCQECVISSCVPILWKKKKKSRN